jgi:amidase
MWELARAHDTISLLTAHGRLETVARTIITALAPYDLVLTPALAQPPLHIGELHGLGPDPMAHYRRSGHFTPYTAICNVTGLPAISLPLYQDGNGLPLAIQLIGRPAREDVLLAAATQLEAALPWAGRVPPL